MAISRFVISILDTETGEHAFLRPGGVSERDLIEQAVQAISRRGVGVFKTEAQVKHAVKEGMKDVLKALKSDVEPVRGR